MQLNFSSLLFFVSSGLATQVSVFTDINFRGLNSVLNITSCQRTLSPQINLKIKSVHTQDNCVQLYKGVNCTGPYVVLLPGSHFHEDLNHYGFQNAIRSLGPCYESCHEDKIPENLSHIVQFINNAYAFNISLEAKQCRNISKELENISYGWVYFKALAKVCLELHENADCSGSTVELNLGKHTTMETVDFVKHSSMIKGNVGAISICGYNCDKTKGPRSNNIAGNDGSIASQKHAIITICILMVALLVFLSIMFFRLYRKRYAIKRKSEVEELSTFVYESL